MPNLINTIGGKAVAIVAPLAVILALVAVLFVWGPRPGTQPTTSEIWTCSMHPQVRLDKPGRCPICGMNLIPLAQLSSEQTRIQTQAGLEVEQVRHRELFKDIRTVGKLNYDESRVAFITARIAGRVDRVFADFTGIQVKKGDHLVSIYSPDLYTTQAELFRALEALDKSPGDQRLFLSTVEAARTKLRLLGILPEQIAQLEKSRTQLTDLTIYAPIGGVVIEKNIREQQYVKEGDMLYQIAELDPIWLYLDVYEYDLSWLRFGQSVDVTVEAYPGEIFRGTIVFIDPFLDDKTRTVKVRVNLKNPDHRLKAAMYASATIHVRLQADGMPQPTGLEGKYICPMHPEIVRDAHGRCPICEMSLEKVPALFRTRNAAPDVVVAAPNGKPQPAVNEVLAVRKKAVLDTGRRQIVFRRTPDGAYELVEVKLGSLAEAKDDAGNAALFYPVLSGLKAGDPVVVQGGFLLDSQRQLEGMPSLLYTEGRSAANLHAGHGGGMPAGTTPSQPAPPPAGGHRH